MATRAALPWPATRTETGFDFGDALGALAEQHGAQRAQAAKTLREYALDVPEPGIGALRFEDFPFQEEWYSEEVAAAAEVVLAKSAQIGASAWAIRRTIRQTDQFGDTSVYIFPTDDHVREFGDERIEPAIEASPYLLSRIPRHFVHTKKLKRIGRGFMHLRGSNSKAGAQSIAAQMLVFDEYDLLDQTNLVQIERRISGAKQIGKQPRILRLGYPFTVASGIDAAHASSDQRVWHVTCSACGDEQPIMWEENFRWTMPGVSDLETGKPRVFRAGRDEFEDRKVLGEVWRCCRSCEQSFEDSSPLARDGVLRSGRWIAQRPESNIVGFHAWRGMVPVTDLAALVIASRATKDAEREAFMVLDLGRPMAAEGSRLDEASLLRACSMGVERVEFYRGPHATTMGVDVAGERALNVQIDEQLPADHPGVSNPRQSLWIGTCESFEQVEQLIVRFNVHVAAIDSNPERRMVRALRGRFPGRVVLVEYDGNPLGEPLVVTSDEVGVPLKVRVNRTDALDGMMDAIRQCRSRPVRNPPPGWMAQMKSLVRKTELDTKGRPVRRYVTTGSDGDDYGHAAAYALVATELWRVFGSVQQAMIEAQGRPLPDEEMGFRRLGLTVDRDQPGGSY